MQKELDEVLDWPPHDTERTEPADPVAIYRHEIDLLMSSGKTKESDEWKDLDRKMDLIYGKSGAEEIRKATL